MSRQWILRALCVASLACASLAAADETCQSPYCRRSPGQEDYVYVWTLGVDGLGDGSDKLVTVGANPGRAELRQGRLLGLRRRPARGASRRLHRRPPLPLGRRPRRQRDLRLRRRRRSRPPEARATINDFAEKTGGVVGPHTFYALPGPHADHRPLELEGSRRPDRPRRVRQRRRVRAHDLDARRRRVRLRRAREAAPQPHAHLVLHRPQELHARRCPSSWATPRR